MTVTTIALVQEADERGLKLQAHGEDLHVVPAERCPAEFAQVLKTHKRALLALLRLPFLMVYSDTLEETVFFCADEATRDELEEAGAEAWSIYTKDELQTLCEQNRVAPLTAAELRKVSELKCSFNGRLTT